MWCSLWCHRQTENAVALFPDLAFPSFLLLAVFSGTASNGESWVEPEDEAKMQSFRFRIVLPCFACNPMQEHDTNEQPKVACHQTIPQIQLLWQNDGLLRADSFWTHHSSNIVMYTTLRSRTQTITYTTSSCYRDVVSMGFLGKQPSYHGDMVIYYHGDMLI